MLESLEEHVRGEILRPESDGYDEARRLWNAMVDMRPALIARCAGAADVMAAVRCARENGLAVAVRGGGHNVAGLASVHGGLVIDLSRMTAVHVDVEARTVRVQGGATWGDVDHETQAFGVATPGGIISTTGVGGLTLGGGFGWLSRSYGLAADNLVSADVVTADGTLLKAKADQNADLFWAIRGGGGNFGIATSLEFTLHDTGPAVLFGPTVHRLDDAFDVLRFYRTFAREAPNECSVYVDLLTAPPLPFLPEKVHGTKVLSLIQCYVGEVEKGKKVLAPLRAFGQPLGDAVAVRPYAAAQRISDALYAPGARNYWKSHNLTTLSDALIDTLVACAETLPTPQSDILMHQLGGRINTVEPEATAYPHRDTEFVVTPGGRWQDPAQDEECLAWVRECHSALSEHVGRGVYINFLAHDEDTDRLLAAYGVNAERLRMIKSKYDPDNFFRRNHNITPAQRSGR